MAKTSKSNTKNHFPQLDYVSYFDVLLAEKLRGKKPTKPYSSIKFLQQIIRG